MEQRVFTMAMIRGIDDLLLARPFWPYCSGTVSTVAAVLPHLATEEKAIWQPS
jgi:hypothetical protein